MHNGPKGQNNDGGDDAYDDDGDAYNLDLDSVQGYQVDPVLPRAEALKIAKVPEKLQSNRSYWVDGVFIWRQVWNQEQMT